MAFDLHVFRDKDGNMRVAMTDENGKRSPALYSSCWQGWTIEELHDELADLIENDTK